MSKRDEVFAAADELVRQGIKPTLEAIRKKTSGSYSTLSPLLSEWKTNRQNADKERDPLPEEVQQRFQQMGRDFWDVACAHAENRFAFEKDQLRKESENLKAEQGELTAIADQLQVRATELSEENRQLKVETEHLVEAVQEERSKTLEVTSTLKALQAQAEAREAHLRELSDELARLRKTDAERVSERDDFIAQIGNLKGQVEQLERQRDLMVKTGTS